MFSKCALKKRWLGRRRAARIWPLWLLLCLVQFAVLKCEAATTRTWDGGGTNAFWDTVVNWDNDALPATSDIVQFSTGLGSGAAINLNGNRTAASLTINTLSAFSITNSTLTLSSGDITRNDIAGTEADHTITSGIALGADGSWTINGSGSLIASGVISGSQKLTKLGTGTLVLSGVNTFSGLTTVSAGVLNAQNSSAFGTTAGNVSITSGAAIQLQGSIAIGTEALTLNGTGISGDGALRNISGNNSWAGAVSLGSATTIASDAGTMTLSGAINNGGGTLTVDGASDTTLSGVISGSGGLTKTGSGSLTLNGSGLNTYSGNTAVNQGILYLNKSVANGAITDTVTIGDGVGGEKADIVRYLPNTQMDSGSGTGMTFKNSG